MKRAEFLKTITPFVPVGSPETIIDWVEKHRMQLSIKNDRKTKLGDFRGALRAGEVHKISINGGLNPFEFLITLIHEFAHLVVFEQYGRKAQAHGPEWKRAYQQLIIPYFELNAFPEPLRSVFLKHMRNPKASSHGDLKMVRVLALYDTADNTKITYLESLDEGAHFELNGKVFIKGEKRRTRFMCKEVITHKLFTVSALAEVSEI